MNRFASEALDRFRGPEIVKRWTALLATIHTINGFSAHAGQDQLMAWAKAFDKPRPRLFLVHGEPESMQVLQKRLAHELHWDALMPEEGETHEI